MRSLVGALAGGLRNKAPVSYAPRGAGRFGAMFQRNDAEAQMRAMGSVGTLFAIVNRTSNAVALVDWKLWRKAPSGLPEDRTEVTSHAALTLWNQPNPWMPRQEFVETFEQHIDLTGEGWWIIGRHARASIPLELWPARPDRMLPVPDPEAFLKGYVYRSPDGFQMPLELDQVIQLRMPNPLDPYRGMGPVQSVLADLDATRYSAEWNRSFFLNSAEPGGIIEVPDRLGDEEFNELRDRWNEQHKGVANAHRVAILEHGVWKDRKLSQRDMQFVELRDVSSKVIREAFGMPKFAVGDVEDINRATAEASKGWFAEQLTVPRLERIKAALNCDLLPLFGRAAEGLEFDYENPVPPDQEAQNAERESKARAAKDLIEVGAYGPAVLEALGLPEIPFGQPDADPDRELLIDLLKGSSGTAELAEKLLTMLGFDVPVKEEPPAPALPPPPAPVDDPEALADPDAAMKWVAVEVVDDNTCEPCKKNDGRLYRNREAAYRDYPGGQGYVGCVGAEHGHECRGTVRKRRASDD
ncbi:phage portal protein [Streptomyces phytophilus]|uniref:phage portal protein n=1 Tax=Streptomyces phytophilus TaxID=722715 RepID=UPI0015F08B58|nr:phage portal protein [Streptomyces phytophilus]